MAADRLLRILTLLGAAEEADGRRLCAVAAEVTQLNGAGIMILGDGRPQASICTSNEVSAFIEELQYTLGEGPCVDAHRLGAVVAEPDLETAGPTRWATFSAPALGAGVRAVGFPIRLGAVRLGALNLYRDRAGPLSDDQHADALVMADVAARDVLVAQAEAPPDELSADLAADLNQWPGVHQAAGMISHQLGITVDAALARLRAHAFRTDRLVSEVAQDVVERRLELEQDPDPPAPG